jgi:hypothetical protein
MSLTNGRRTGGTISEAYAVVNVWKTPHEIPLKASPVANTGSEGAKTEMKIVHVNHAMKNLECVR